ncbi:MAG: helix-turn-helix domain-containing protein [Anaerolineae bacterium]
MNKVNRFTQQKPTLRQRQAAATANLIVTAAKELFLVQGYANTTIEAIAERAGVAASTVYAVFGSKRGILRAIRAAWHEQSHIREVTYGDWGDATAEERIDKLAQGTRSQWETGANVVAIYSSAAAADPEAAAELSVALEGRRKGMEKFAQSLERYLVPGLGTTRAADILQALCSPELFNELVRRSAWPLDDYQLWLSRILKHELLGR